jgi:hypothetical protein
MAAASILATASTGASSGDITLIATYTLVALKGAADGAKCFVEVKDDGGAYVVIATLTSSYLSAQLPPGIYRFRRPAGIACGVFQAA